MTICLVRLMPLDIGVPCSVRAESDYAFSRLTLNLISQLSSFCSLCNILCLVSWSALMISFWDSMLCWVWTLPLCWFSVDIILFLLLLWQVGPHSLMCATADLSVWLTLTQMSFVVFASCFNGSTCLFWTCFSTFAENVIGPWDFQS
jgi:hypothetical protein